MNAPQNFQSPEENSPEYFNRINFREIKFRGFANFRRFRENKTHEIVWDSSFAKLNLREIF